MRAIYLLLLCVILAGAQTKAVEELRHPESAIEIQQRAVLMEQLIRTDPQRALSLALSDEALATLRTRFPESDSFLETRGEWEGPMTVVVEDDFEHHRSRTIRLIEIGGRRVQVQGALPAVPGCGRRVKVRGIRLGDQIAASSSRDAGPAQSGACVTTGEQKVAVIIVNYPHATLPNWVTPDAIQNMYLTGAASMSEFWRENSYGLAWASGAVFGPFLLATDFRCDQFFEMADAAIAAVDSSVDLRVYTRIMIVAPAPQGGCSYAGISTVGCTNFPSPSKGVLEASASALSVRSDITMDAYKTVAYHESGHGLGVAHARSLDYDTIPLGAPGVDGVYGEYGDSYSNMGIGNNFHWAAPHKAMLGWLSAGNIQQIEPGGLYSGVTLQPYETPTTLPLAGRIQRPGSDQWLWVEARQGLGTFDANIYSQALSGVVVHLENELLQELQTNLLHFNPQHIPNDFTNAPLQSVWQDPYSPLALSISNQPSGRVVSVTYDTPCATLSATKQIHTYTAQSGTIAITGSGVCTWVAAANASWITINSGQSGTGNGSVQYSIAENTTGGYRSGAIYVARQKYVIWQEPSGPKLSVMTTHSGTFQRGGSGTFSITVTNTLGAATAGQAGITARVSAGLTITGFSGAGWTCNLQPFSCTRGDSLASGASYPVLNVTVGVALSAPDTVSIDGEVSLTNGSTNVLGLVSDSVTGIGMVCTVNTAVPPTLRVESLSEIAGDIVINCTGGTPTPAGNAVPQVNFELTLNTNVTNRVTAPAWSDALLIVDEPHSASKMTTPVLACGMAGSNDDGNGVCSITGDGTGQNTYNGTAGHANVFQAQISGANKLLWTGVPFDPPGATGYRTIRITNIRANVNSLGLSTPMPTQLVANVAATPALPISNSPQQTVAFISQGLAVIPPAATSLSQCLSANPSIATDTSKPLDTGGQNGYQFTIQLAEGFPSAWREKNVQL